MEVDKEIHIINPRVYAKESMWHSDWKNAFPVAFREVSFKDQVLAQLHRADVHTPCGTTIEFQNSPITLQELKSREAFYPRLIWMVNGKKFKGFKILKHLPDVDDYRLRDFEFRHKENLSMVRKQEIIQGSLKPKVLTFHHPELRDIPFTSYNYSFCWKHPHRVWYEAKCPIFIDLGGYFIYQLKQRQQLSGDYAYLHMMPRQVFIQQYIGG